ncbi:MAG: hypothetical protein K2P78_14905, partial [Gemmataceae bacterium]|nr:hypothetical protein [Gemmataceae bacterium]
LHPPADFSFGPARPEEFREPTRHFVHRELHPALRPAERLALKGADGKWPEYPRLMTQLARLHDLGVPGVTLPGKPSQWERTYGGTGRPAFRPKA